MHNQHQYLLARELAAQPQYVSLTLGDAKLNGESCEDFGGVPVERCRGHENHSGCGRARGDRKRWGCAGGLVGGDRW